MKKQNKEKLIKELIEEGATQKEAYQMLSLAGKVSQLSAVRLSDKAKKKFLESLEEEKKVSQQGYSRWVYVPAMFLSLMIIVLSTNTVVEAQESIPGEPLYPLKRVTETVMMKVNSDFKDVVIERRSKEIKTLVEENKEKNLIESTIEDYEEHLEKVENIDTDRVEKSKENLEEVKEKISIERNRIEELIRKIEKKRSIRRGLERRFEVSRRKDASASAEEKNSSDSASENEEIRGRRFEK